MVLVASVIALLTGCRSEARSATTAAQVFATATPTPVALTRYTNPAYPYEIGYPAGWQAETANHEAVRFDGPPGRRISVDVQPVPQRQPPFTLPAYADAQVEALRKTTPGLIELQRTRIALPNRTAAIEVDLMWNEGSAQHRALLLYVLDAGIAFVVRGEAPPSAFPQERRTLDASLRSFTLTPPD